MSVYEAVKAHHEIHGDDFGREESRHIRYDAALSLFPRTYDSLLDVGAGSGRFRLWLGTQIEYTGIDLLDGVNVMDYDEQHDLVVALGVLYRVPTREQINLIHHMWELAQKALVVQTISTDGRTPDPGEWPADLNWLFRSSSLLSSKIALRTDYLSGDVTIALYR